MHPPVLLVFHQVGKRSAKSRTQRAADLTRHHWQGRWHGDGGFHSYDGRIPIVATTLDLLREHGPAGPAFWRFGRDHHEPLLDTVGNPRRDAYLARRAEAHREEEQRRAERELEQAHGAGGGRNAGLAGFTGKGQQMLTTSGDMRVWRCSIAGRLEEVGQPVLREVLEDRAQPRAAHGW